MDNISIEKIRKDFPVINRLVKGKPIIYFDNACQSLVPKQVIDEIVDYYNNYSSCAGRSIHYLSTQVSLKFEASRDRAAKFFNTKSNEIVFVRNTTEGINLVARSYPFEKGDVILTTDREHNSNLSIWHVLKEEKGIIHKAVPSKEDNLFDLEAFKGMIDSKVKMISMAHVSNLDGVEIPVKDIIDIAHSKNIPVMLDGAQAAPHMKIDLKKMDVDFYSISLHKMCGPTGTGILYGKYDLLKNLKPFIVGGSTVADTFIDKTVFLDPPERFEAGLQNYANVIASAKSFDYLSNIGMDFINERVKELNKIITNGLKDIPEISIIGPVDSDLRSGIFPFNIKGMSPHDVAMILDEFENIYIRSGRHCDHSWFNKKGISGSARASLQFYNTKEEAKKFVETVIKIIDSFSKLKKNG